MVTTKSTRSKNQNQKTHIQTKKAQVSNTSFTIRNCNIIQTILNKTLSRIKIPITFEENEDTVPFTFIEDNESDADIPISQILHEKSKRAYYFLDTRKIPQKYWGNMIDVTENGPLPSRTSKMCWWCRHSFQNSPIGCPIRYNPSGDCIEQNRFVENMKKANIHIDNNDLFETEGLFCSFPCCKSFILDQRGAVKYKDSLSLLSLLFKIYYKRDQEIPAAPSWKLIKDYGGHLSIQEFRASFDILDFTETPNIRRPYIFSSSQYISEKKIKLFRGITTD